MNTIHCQPLDIRRLTSRHQLYDLSTSRSFGIAVGLPMLRFLFPTAPLRGLGNEWE